MHYVVANLYLRQLFQRKGELAGTHTVAFQSIFVETLEYLMVGEHAYFKVVVNESLVHGVEYRLERYQVAAVVEYHAQTLELRLVVGKYVDFVTVFFEFLERFADYVEILVENTLQGAVEADSCVVLPGVVHSVVYLSE